MPWTYRCPSTDCDETFDVHPDADAHVADAHPGSALVVPPGEFVPMHVAVARNAAAR